MKHWVIGDIHGNLRGLVQALDRAGVDRENDLLIQLGDICDGYGGVYEVVEELLLFKNLIVIEGNHDNPFIEFFHTGLHPWKWEQGGEGTLRSYSRYAGIEDLMYYDKGGWGNGGWKYALNPEDIPITHQKFFKSMVKYYIDEKNNLFVHGGFNRHESIKGQNKLNLMWDRDLWLAALSFRDMPGRVSDKPYKFKMKDNFNHVFIGHTTTQNWNTTEPMEAANITNLDTGAGFGGKVTIMNIDDRNEYYQSDLASDLYPDEKGRRIK